MEDVVANLGCGCSFLASSSSSVALWSITKKKPLVSQPHHQGPLAGAPASSLEESWVTSVSAYTSTDLVASGSNNGYVCLWKCGDRLRSLEPCFSIPLGGFINALAFSHCGSYLVAGVGQEHRLGRWWKDRNAKNGIAILPLHKNV